MSNEALIIDLSSDLAPIQRRSMLREGGLVLALGAAELALFLALGVMRPDMHHMAGSPYLIWRVGSLGLLAMVACALAIRSYAPTARPARGLMIACVLAVFAIVGGAFVAPAGVGERALLDRINPAAGMLCAASIFVLSLPIVTLLGALMRRAAPTRPRLSALASGIAAGACGAFVFAFCCPFNDPLYVVVWYSIGCGAVAAAARWHLPRRFRL
ncbi:NrsF family protein [Novosphingobium gossypii]|uniref:NrsF family protein n=1 Tax=Novosphingobium gossypii TaxID=1604774 RepID=UPI003D191E87